MTNQEAIDILRTNIALDRQEIEYCHDELGIEALEMAIKALEQEPCEDAISRQADIDTIESWLLCDDYNEAERHIMRAMQSVLYDLPPVKPQEPKWIPVCERLPEEGQRVLVTQIFGERTVIYCTTFPFEKIKEKYITAWMPLPKPYDPQKEGDKE